MTLTTNDLITMANAKSDESVDSTTLISFFNDTIATLNAETGASIPDFPITDSSTYKHPLDDKWLRNLIVNYAIYLTHQKEQQPQLGTSFLNMYNYYLILFKRTADLSAFFTDSVQVDSNWIEPDLSANMYTEGW